MFKVSSIQSHMDGRNNNFNLLRMIGALLIMYAHAMFITIGDDITFETYPVKYTLGMTTLNLFFVLSGMLVTSSWLKHEDWLTYAVSRAMRILPGLIVVSFITAFFIGPLVSTQDLTAYFSDLRSWIYWPLTSMLNADVTLPGVFEGLPNDAIVNAPLWTLKYEAFFYISLAILGLFGWLKTRRFTILALLGFSFYFFVTFLTNLREIAAIDHLMHFGYAFLIGACFHIFRKFVPVNLSLALITMGLALLIVYHFGLQTGEFLLIPSAALLGIWIAYVPGGPLRYYNAIGDYSYGVYIWHYPIEQVMRTNLGDVSAMQLYLTSLPIVLPIAIVSWHFVERPSLMAIKTIVPRLKTRFSKQVLDV